MDKVFSYRINFIFQPTLLIFTVLVAIECFWTGINLFSIVHIYSVESMVYKLFTIKLYLDIVGVHMMIHQVHIFELIESPKPFSLKFLMFCSILEKFFQILYAFSKTKAYKRMNMMQTQTIGMAKLGANSREISPTKMRFRSQ